MTTFLVLLALVEVGLPVAIAFGRNSILFFPMASPSPEEGLAAFGRTPARVARVVRPDGRALSAYDVVPDGLPSDAPVMLFFHGNAGNIATRAELAAELAETARVRLLMLEYSGYGGNAGSPSEDELNADALAAFDHLVAAGVEPRRIVVFGESIGGGPALFVATQRPVAGVTVQSTFASLSSMARRVYPWMPLGGLLVRGAFPNGRRMAKLGCPVLIVHGRRDTIVPFEEAEALHAAQPRAELLPVDGADHDDLYDVGGTDYFAALGARFREWTAAPSIQIARHDSASSRGRLRVGGRLQ